MKNILPITALLGTLLSTADLSAQTPPKNEWMNIQGIGWDYGALAQHRYAQAMGYTRVYHERSHDASDEYKDGLWFYLNDSHKHVQPSVDLTITPERLATLKAACPHTFHNFPELPRAIDYSELEVLRELDPEVFEVYKNKIESTKAWSDLDAEFPYNIAVLEAWHGTDRWEACADFQQQAVIDEQVAAIVNYVKSAERPEIGYRFQGLLTDVIEPWVEFGYNSSRPLLPREGEPETEVTSLAPPGVTHDYPTLREGFFHYLAQLNDALDAAFPDREVKMIWEPYDPYQNWIRLLEDGMYDSITPEIVQKIKGDALISEAPELELLIDEKLLRPEYFDHHTIGVVSADLFPFWPHYPTQLWFFGELAARGSYFFSYGNFSRDFSVPINEYDQEIKLVRALSIWENLNQTPLEDRVWDYDKKTYLSSTAVADESALAGYNPIKDEIYAVLRSPESRLYIDPGLKVRSLFKANSFFEKIDSRQAPASIEGGVLTPNPKEVYPLALRIELSDTDRPDRYFTHPQSNQLVEDLADAHLFQDAVINGDFEDGPHGWQAGYAPYRTSVVTDNVKEGQQSLLVSHREKLWQGASQRVTGIFKQQGPGTYRISAWVRTRQGEGDFRLMLNYKDLDLRETMETAKRVGTEWAQITAEFTLDWEDLDLAAISIRRLDSLKAYFVDDVTLQKMP